MSEKKIYNPIRLTNGKVVDYKNLLRKAPSGKTLTVEKANPAQELERLGIRGETKVTYRRDKDGNVMYDSQGRPMAVTQFTPREIPAWFTKAIMVLSEHEPCYFEGCEEIVQQYKSELKALEKRPGGCRDCDKAKLKRKYSTMFRNALPPNEVNKVAQPTIPPHTITNLATNETISVPRKLAPYSSIKREVPEGVQEIFTKKANERKLFVNGEEISIDALDPSKQPKIPGITTGSGNSSNQ